MAFSEQSDVHVTVFGGLKLLRPSIDLSPRPPRERLILARLVAAQGTPVSASELVDALWNDNPPTTAVNQIQRHIGELRRLLEPMLPPRASGSYVQAVGEAYRLNMSLCSSDLGDALELWRAARAASPAIAAQLYDDALSLVVEPPLPDLPWSMRERPEFAAIRRDRISLAIDAADFALRAGGNPTTLSSIEVIAADAPLDERLQSRLIALLARAGRRADAVHVFEATKTALFLELDMLPSAELLSAINVVLLKATELPPGPRGRLPALPRAIVVRAQFDSVLEEATASAVAGNSALVVISGMAGIGKTTLALAWGHSVAPIFPDGQLLVDLRGFDGSSGSVSASAGLGRILEGLGVNLSGVRPDEAARREVYLGLMSNRRMVVILDNAGDVDQVRALLPDSPESLVIVTSRRQLSGLVVREGAVPVPLQRWDATASRELLARRLGSERLATAGDAVESIIASCGGLPLALALAAAASASHSHVSDVAARLAATATALDVLSVDGSDDLRSTFEWSLEVVSQDAALVFGLASAHPGSQLSLSALAAVSGLELVRAGRAVSELFSANLLIRVAEDRYIMHDLLRIYARERASGGAHVAQAQKRLLLYYVHSMRQAYLAFGRPPVLDLLVVEPSQQIEYFMSPKQAVAWFVAERQALSAVFHWAIAEGLDREAAFLALDWRPMIQTVEGAATILPLVKLATAAAARINEPRLEVELRRDLAHQLGSIGDQEQSTTEYETVLSAYRALGDLIGESNAWRNMALAGLGGSKKLKYARRAVEVARQSEDLGTLANALVTIAGAFAAPGSAREKAAAATEALRTIDKSGLEYLRPYAKCYLASAHVEMGNYQAALEAVEGMDEAGDPTLMRMLTGILTRAWAGLGDWKNASTALSSYDRAASSYSEYFSDLAYDREEAHQVEEVRALIETAGL
jgi:DNA-binding SARP family transcriptional activator